MSIKYSICSTHYNMAKTVEKSLNSILEQIDERFEVVVVDEGSTDGSLEILKRLEKEEENLRVIVKEKNGRNLGKTRNMSIREAKGDYVLPQLDMDDYYEEGIMDFVEVFHQIDRGTDFDFYLSGNGINMVKKDFFWKIGGYRDLPVGAEDLDLWRRLFAKDAIIWLEHKSFCREIGGEKNAWDKFKRTLTVRRGELRSGIEFKSYFKWLFSSPEVSFFSLPAHLVAILLARISLSIQEEGKKMELPTELKKKGVLEKKIRESKKSLLDLEREFDFKIDRTKLSKKGKNIFYQSSIEKQGKR